MEECRRGVPVLEEVPERAILVASDPAAPTNHLIEADNFAALSVLSATHAGKVDLIYIDPPYNTGNRDFIYDDHYVDAEDAYRHSKWLSFMRRRLALAWSLLADTGVIFISIGDDEQAHLKVLCDQVFGPQAFIANVIWKCKRGRDNSAKLFSRSHEYLLVYAKSKAALKFNRLEMDGKTRKAYRNTDEDPRGSYRLLGVWARGTQGGSRYAFTAKTGEHFSERLWLTSEEGMRALEREDPHRRPRRRLSGDARPTAPGAT